MVMNIPGVLTGFASGIAANIATQKVTTAVDPTVNQALGIEPKSTEDILTDIHLLLVHLAKMYINSQSGQGDIYQFVDITKFGVGQPFLPKHTGTRQHFQLFATSVVVLNCSGTGLGNFNVSTKAGDWINLDFPDGAVYILDATAPNPKQTFWFRETNAQVV